MTSSKISRWVLVGAVASASPALAVIKYWDTSASAGLNAGNGTWDTGVSSVWNTASDGSAALTTWSNGDDAYFSTGGTNVIALDGTIQAASINTRTATVTTLNGGTLQLTGATGVLGSGSSGDGFITINSDVAITQNQAWSNSNGSTLTTNGDVSGAFSLTLTAGGTGGQRQIHLNGTNTLNALSVNGSGSTARTAYISGDTTLTGALSGSGTQATNSQIFAGGDLTVASITQGTGTMGLGGSNTVSGAVTVSNGGTLVISSDANIGGASSTLTLSSGTLRMLGTGVSAFGTHTVTFGSGGNTRLDVADASHTFTADKIINSGAGGFSKYGAGKVVLTKANTYTGATAVRGGVLEIDNNVGGSVSSSSALTLNGGTLLLNGNDTGTTTQAMGAVTVERHGSNIVVDGGTSSATTLNLGAITAATTGGALNFKTIGTTTPTITTTSALPGTGIYGARLTFNGADWASTASGSSPYTLGAYANYNNGGTFATSGTNTDNALVSGSSALAGDLTTNTLKIATTGGSQSLNLGASTLSLSDGGLLFAGADNYTVSGGTLKSMTATASDLIIHQNGTSGATLTISSVIANGVGASTLTKFGDGKLILSGVNTFTGATYIAGGTLSVNVLAGTNNNLGAAISQAMVLNGGTLEYTGASATRSSGITLGSAGGSFDITNSGTALILSGVLTDETGNTDGRFGGLTKKGAGTLTLSASNSFSGDVIIEAGVLQLNSGNALNPTTPNIVNFSSGSTGTLRLNGTSPMIAGLNTGATAGTTFVENNHASTASTLTVNTTFASTYAGVIRNGAAASLGLAKLGGNSLTLTNSNLYTGATTVTAGTLVVDGSIASSSLTSVGLAGRLGGNGNVGTASVTGVIAPGNSIGSMAATSLTLNTGGRLESEIGTGVSADLLTVSGAVDLSATGDVLELLGSVSNFNGSPRTLVNYGSLSGAFSTVTLNGSVIGDPSSFVVNGYTYGLDYGDGSSDAIKLVIVPEPATLSLLAMGALGLLRRRRA